MRTETPACEHCAHKKDSLFHFCHLRELDAIDERKTCSTYKRGQIIFQEGTNPFGLFCINEGKVKLYKYASDGKEQIVRIAKAGDFVGYSSLLANQRYHLTAQALEDAQVCMIPKDEIQSVMSKNHNFADQMIQLLGRSVNDSVDRMADMAYKPVRGRMAEALLFLNTFYINEDNEEGTITMTREDLASFVGTVKETAIRILKEFKEDKLISTQKSDIMIHDVDGLIRVSHLYD